MAYALEILVAASEYRLSNTDMNCEVEHSEESGNRGVLRTDKGSSNLSPSEKVCRIGGRIREGLWGTFSPALPQCLPLTLSLVRKAQLRLLCMGGTE